MIHWPNLLLIGGTNRNVGKTTFACKIIGALKHKCKVVALKISPHVHGDCDTCKLIYKTDSVIIYEELANNTTKDSSRMLAVGASKALYIQCLDSNIPEAIKVLETLIPVNEPIVCESAGMRNYIKPGLFVVLSDNKQAVKNAHLIQLADLHFTNMVFNTDIDFNNGKWQY